MSHTEGYWTPERMHNAVPPPLRKLADAEEALQFELLQNKNNKNRGTTMDCPGATEQYLNTTFEGVYNVAPALTIGKIFFASGGRDFVCSGSIAQNRSFVWTAGHCIFDHSVFAYVTELQFVPQYFNNTSPYGAYEALRVHANGNWITSSRFEYDYAIAEFRTPFPAALGSFPLQTNIASPGTTTYRTYGYPAAPPFSGEFLNLCTSIGCQRDTSKSPPTVGITCDSTGGSSGGPFLINTGASSSIAGVVSYGYDQLPNLLFTAYFNDATADFYNAVISGQDPGSSLPVDESVGEALISSAFLLNLF